MSSRKDGAYLNELWQVGAAHALYIHDGHWYHPLKRFPGALFDRNGYVLFRTEDDFRTSSYLSIGKQVSVRKPGISAIPGYVRVLDGSSRSPALPPEEVAPAGVFSEGGVVRIQVNRYERDASIGMKYRVDPVRDLRPICANCHSVVHRREPPYTIDEVRAMVMKARAGGRDDPSTRREP